MIQKYRKQFNEEFSPEKYQKLIETLEKSSGTTNGFRQSESPIFLSKDFKNKLTDACDSIISQVKTFSNEELQKAIPKHLFVPNDTEKPHFLAIDFGICKTTLDSCKTEKEQFLNICRTVVFEELLEIHPFIKYIYSIIYAILKNVCNIFVSSVLHGDYIGCSIIKTTSLGAPKRIFILDVPMPFVMIMGIPFVEYFNPVRNRLP